MSLRLMGIRELLSGVLMVSCRFLLALSFEEYDAMLMRLNLQLRSKEITLDLV